MPLVIGLDIGTTTITALAVDADGIVRATESHAHYASDFVGLARPRRLREYDSYHSEAIRVLHRISERLGSAMLEVVGIAVTGQQHGCLLLKGRASPRSPFVDWQNRRANELFPGSTRSFVEEAIVRCGLELSNRTGCRLAAGYMATTLFRWQALGRIRPQRRACFLPDLIAADLARTQPVTDATMAASSGVFNLTRMDWDDEAIVALGLSRDLFPSIRRCGSAIGPLNRIHARIMGMPRAEIYVGLGDHQASFLGAVADPANSLFINVGTGGQVAAYISDYQYDPELETRPFPGGGYDLVSAGLTGGSAYAVLESFFRSIGREFFTDEPTSLFAQLNALAAKVSPGCDGLRCEPFFTGTRQEPTRTVTWTGMTERNFTPGHMARAVLEGMARALREGAERIEKLLPNKRPIIVGAGNGIRQNPLFVEILSREFGRPIRVPHHREEAAYGAAIVAAIGAEILPDIAAAKRWIRYDETQML